MPLDQPCCIQCTTLPLATLYGCLQTVADRLGLQRRPLRGPGAVFSILYNGLPTPLEVLNEPLTVQLLAGPNNVVLEVTLPAVVVVPDLSGWNNTLFELQLGLFDFCAAVEMDWLPMWASQFRDIASGYCCAVPVIAPPPPHAYSHIRGSSTFHIAQESYEEVRLAKVADCGILHAATGMAATSCILEHQQISRLLTLRTTCCVNQPRCPIYCHLSLHRCWSLP